MAKEKGKDNSKDNIIAIGKKDMHKYVTSALIQLQNSNNIMIVARGRQIARAVSLSQILKNKFNFKIGKVEIGTEEIETESGKANVSNISIEVFR